MCEPITIFREPDEDLLCERGVRDWPIWTKETSEFPWYYEETETCYFLEGEVVVTPEDGSPVHMGAGDLVVFPRGMACHWKILKPVRKHYDFG